MTTPTQRVRALTRAIADLRRGDLEAVIDLDCQVGEDRYPDYGIWYDLRHDDPDFLREFADESGNFSGEGEPEHLRYFLPERSFAGISGHILGRIWEFHLADILYGGATEHYPPRPGDPADLPLLQDRLPRTMVIGAKDAGPPASSESEPAEDDDRTTH
jgi:hypothetical protein